MAWIWHMVVNFIDETRAKTFIENENFDKSKFILPHSGEVDLRIGYEKNECGWEVGICPYVRKDGKWWHLNDHGNIYSQTELEDINECAKVLYERFAWAY